MRFKYFIIPFLFFILSTPISPINIRHDVKHKAYIKYAKLKHFKPGLIITRPNVKISGSGVLIHKNYIVTAGHIVSSHGPANMTVLYNRVKYIIDYVYLFPGYNLKQRKKLGNDVAILRIKGKGIKQINPAVISKIKITKGTIIYGVGQGKSSTGVEKREILSHGTFRGYQNIVDYISKFRFNMFVTDFDDPCGKGNSLNKILYFNKKRINCNSCSKPLPLEGSLAKGDSGSGVWIKLHGKYYLVGIASGRYYSRYSAQSIYINLTNNYVRAWILTIIPNLKLSD